MLLLEASYKEFFQRYEKDMPFGIISASQGDLPESTNQANNKILRRKIADEGYDQVRVIGKYPESNAEFESMIVFCGDKDEKEFVRFLLFFAKKYEQNGIIYVDSENIIWKFPTRTNSTWGGIGSKIRLDKFYMFDVEKLIDDFSKRTYEVEKVRVVTD